MHCSVDASSLSGDGYSSVNVDAPAPMGSPEVQPGRERRVRGHKLSLKALERRDARLLSRRWTER